jgi:glutathione S-transferase
MKLYSSPMSSPSRAVMGIFKHLKIPYEPVTLDLFKGREQKSEEYMKINPNGRVPLLYEEDGFILFETWAILRYALDKYAPGNTLYPSDIKTRGEIDMLIGHVNDYRII